MEGSTAIPPEIQAAADRLGVPAEQLLQYTQNPQTAAPAADAPAATEAKAVPTETDQEKLERELAESRQETQQARKIAQVAGEGRVIGSGGGGVVGAAATDLPNLGMIEPGIRFEYLNGLISDEELSAKVGTLMAALLKKHEGGVI
jgi:transposase-like protein